MYDPATGEGLVCVNGRCISNKKKFQMHDEDDIGLHSGRRRRRNGRRRLPRNANGRAQGGGANRPPRRNMRNRQNSIFPQDGEEGDEQEGGDGEEKTGGSSQRANGLDLHDYFMDESESEGDYGDEEDGSDDDDEYYDEVDMLPFAKTDGVAEEFKDGNVYNFSGAKA